MHTAATSSSKAHEAKYQVFLSFRGEDTRDNFISHLFKDLRCNKGIETFIDDTGLQRGDEISESLFKAIEESKIAIIVFSKDYASSKWCLEELVKILDCKESRGLIALPVFYQVDPSDVRNQTGTFGEAFVKHEERFKENSEKVQRWRRALNEAANLSGFDSKNWSESALVDKVVKDVLKRLNRMSPSYNRCLVGVAFSINKIVSLLCNESEDVFAVGIWGMGGIGKTTLARVVFDKIKSQFESVYFQNNVREESQKVGLLSMQKKILSEILQDECASLESTLTRNRLRCKKILIVLDDVTCFNQMEELIADVEHFGSVGSRILITSRDKQVLQICGVNQRNIYEVKSLPNNESLELFSLHAFKKNHPTVDYMELSERVVTFVKGVPLALKVFGSMLFDKSKTIWESAVDNLAKISNWEIHNVLKLSFDELNNVEKNLFLDIACFYVGAGKDFVMAILNASKIGLSVLVDKSLINISYDSKTMQHVIKMHDLLQEMGRKIVEEESKCLGNRSRLWHHEDVYRVLRTMSGAEAVEGIHLDLSKIEPINLKPHSLLRMSNLRLLDFHPSGCVDWFPYPPFLSICYNKLPSGHQVFSSEKESDNKVHALEGLEFDLTGLLFLRWYGCPLKSLPSNSDAVNLRVLVMPFSSIVQFGNDVQRFNKLKHIDLSYSLHLTKIPDLSLFPDLENLILEGCSGLIEVASSKPCLNNLIILNLGECKSLSSFPRFQSRSLKIVVLSNCQKLEMSPKISCSMVRVDLDGTAIKELSLIEYPSTLPQLNLETLYSRRPIQFGFDLDLSRCQITKLPDSLSQLSSLTTLNLSGNKLECLPASIKGLSKLWYLDVSYCERLQSLPELPGSVKELHAQNCTSLETFSNLSFMLDAWVNREVNFANCFNLDTNAIEEKVLLKFKPQGRCFSARAAICYPGTEIPDYFSHQNMGSSITLKLPLDCMKKMSPYVRFVVCAVVVFGNYHDKILPVWYKCTTKDKDGKMRDQYLGRLLFEFNHVNYFNRCYIKSDHVFLGYDFSGRCLQIKQVKRENYKIKSDFYDSVTIDFYVDGSNTQVKKCGVQILEEWEGVAGSDENQEEGKEEEEEEEEEEDRQLKKLKFEGESILKTARLNRKTQ